MEDILENRDVDVASSEDFGFDWSPEIGNVSCRNDKGWTSVDGFSMCAFGVSVAIDSLSGTLTLKLGRAFSGCTLRSENIWDVCCQDSDWETLLIAQKPRLHSVALAHGATDQDGHGDLVPKISYLDSDLRGLIDAYVKAFNAYAPSRHLAEFNARAENIDCGVIVHFRAGLENALNDVFAHNPRVQNNLNRVAKGMGLSNEADAKPHISSISRNILKCFVISRKKNA